MLQEICRFDEFLEVAELCTNRLFGEAVIGLNEFKSILLRVNKMFGEFGVNYSDFDERLPLQYYMRGNDITKDSFYHRVYKKSKLEVSQMACTADREYSTLLTNKLKTFFTKDVYIESLDFIVRVLDYKYLINNVLFGLSVRITYKECTKEFVIPLDSIKNKFDKVTNDKDDVLWRVVKILSSLKSKLDESSSEDYKNLIYNFSLVNDDYEVREVYDTSSINYTKKVLYHKKDYKKIVLVVESDSSSLTTSSDEIVNESVKYVNSLFNYNLFSDPKMFVYFYTAFKTLGILYFWDEGKLFKLFPSVYATEIIEGKVEEYQDLIEFEPVEPDSIVLPIKGVTGKGLDSLSTLLTKDGVTKTAGACIRSFASREVLPKIVFNSDISRFMSLYNLVMTKVGVKNYYLDVNIGYATYKLIKDVLDTNVVEYIKEMTYLGVYLEETLSNANYYHDFVYVNNSEYTPGNDFLRILAKEEGNGSYSLRYVFEVNSDLIVYHVIKSTDEINAIIEERVCPKSK